MIGLGPTTVRHDKLPSVHRLMPGLDRHASSLVLRTRFTPRLCGCLPSPQGFRVCDCTPRICQISAQMHFVSMR
jgi:hypothetical protein